MAHNELDNILHEFEPVTNTAHLDKYLFNSEMRERAFEAAGNGVNALSRAANQPGLKTITIAEEANAFFHFFPLQRNEMREEFWRRLCDILPLSKAKKLIEVINESWTDGMTKRTKSAEILTLKASIRDFVTAKARQGEIYVDELLPDKINPFLNITEVGAIIELTQNLTDLLIQGYLDSFSSDPFTPSSNDLWLHRGLHLITLFKDGVYREQNYISSYTLSISVSEKFAQCISGKKPVIISAPLNNFYNRFLFFSELIPDLDLKQFEFAVVPHWMRINLKYLGEFFGIHEYELD